MMRALNGEVAEWSKALAWKACIRQRIEGSNPSLTAKLKPQVIYLLGAFLFAEGCAHTPTHTVGFGLFAA